MNMYFVPVMAIAALSLTSPFLAFTGFFEKRNADAYQFHIQRFLALIATLFFLNSLSSLFFLLGIEKLFIDAVHVAETAVFKNRAEKDQALNNLFVMFPILSKENTKNCYQSAFSNYIEDQWKISFQKASCQSEHRVCADDEPSFYNKLGSRLAEMAVEG